MIIGAVGQQGHQLIQVGAAFVQDEGTSYQVLVPLTPQGYIPNPYLKAGS